MTTAFIEIKGLDQLIDKLETLAQLRTVKAGIKAGALHVKGVIDVYPASSDANQPGPYPKRWYVRGWGPKWARKSGGIGGINSSEDLGDSWTIKMRDGGFTGVVGNNVSYGIFVQGEKQAAFHQRRGWKTTEMIAKSEGPRVRELIAQAIRRALAA